MRRVFCMSDLHLNWIWSKLDVHNDIQEEWSNKMFTMLPDGAVVGDCKQDILIIAGDLCDDAIKALSYAKMSWMKDVSRLFHHVIVVMGNHDYWGSEFDNLQAQFNRKLVEQHITNVTLLDDSCFEIDNVLFVGGTLWTDFNNQNPLSLFNAPRVMCDYDKIRNSDYIKINQYNIYNKHVVTRKYIESIVTHNKDKQIVVVTHHLPSFALCDKSYRGQNDEYYASNMDYFVVNNPHISHWICGHSHHKKVLTIGKTQCILNPLGYKGYENTGFDNNLHFEIGE